MEDGKTYAARIRKANGASLVCAINAVAGDTKTLTLTEILPLADAPGVGDLVLFGETGKESIECLVKSIEPQSDLTARITCVNAAPAVHTADTGVIPSYESHVTVPADLKRPPAPVIVSVQTGEEALIRNPDGSFSATITMTLAAPAYSATLFTDVQIRATGETDFRTASFLQAGNQIRVIDVEAFEYYDISLVYKNANGMASPQTIITNQNVVGATEPPSDDRYWPQRCRGRH